MLTRAISELTSRLACSFTTHSIQVRPGPSTYLGVIGTVLCLPCERDAPDIRSLIDRACRLVAWSGTAVESVLTLLYSMPDL